MENLGGDVNNHEKRLENAEQAIRPEGPGRDIELRVKVVGTEMLDDGTRIEKEIEVPESELIAGPWRDCGNGNRIRTVAPKDWWGPEGPSGH